MIEHHYTISDRQGRRGALILRGGIWAGDECVFEFTETIGGVSGTARCDWRRPAPLLEVHIGDTDDQQVQLLLQQLGEVLLPFHTGAFDGVGDAELARLYAGEYHAAQNYSTDFEFETSYKQRIVATLMQVAPPQKLLDAGCSAGEVVRQLRRRGVDAHGFDLCPDLDAIAYPEARPFVRQGGVTAIPYGPEDGFDTLTAFDVFEHVPESQLPAMIDEFARLGVRRVIALIALSEFQYLGHITLRPLHWWDQQFGRRFRRCRDATILGTMARNFGADPAKYLAIYELVDAPAEPPPYRLPISAAKLAAIVR